MNKILKNIIVGSICLLAISFWIYKGLNKKLEIVETETTEEDRSNLIFQLLQKDTTLIYDSLIGSSYFIYSDSINYINILKNLETHQISIGEVSPINTTEFISLSYGNTTLNNFKTYLKNNNKIHVWDSLNNSLKTNYNFNINELATYIQEIGSFTSNLGSFYYLKSDEAYNIVSLLTLMEDSIAPQTIKRYLYYKINTNNLFQLLAGEIFSEPKNYYININDYFIFDKDTSSLQSVYHNFTIGKTLNKNRAYINFIKNKFNNYGLNYYSDITTDKDTLNKVLSYQLRGEQNGIISNLNIFYSEKVIDTIVDITLTEEEQIINDIVNSTIESQEKKDLGEVIYTLKEGETFREATVKLEILLEENGYDYNNVKIEHVFFFTDNGNTKLDWNTAKTKYLGKGLTKKGDYFLMKKFYY